MGMSMSILDLKKFTIFEQPYQIQLDVGGWPHSIPSPTASTQVVLFGGIVINSLTIDVKVVGPPGLLRGRGRAQRGRRPH